MAASLAEPISVGIINSDTDGENEVPQQSFGARYTHDADEFAYTVDGRNIQFLHAPLPCLQPQMAFYTASPAENGVAPSADIGCLSWYGVASRKMMVPTWSGGAKLTERWIVSIWAMAICG